ncbi:MAG TPA: DUF4149 domain-containing protein [Pyrinomonadaceae bacterium]|nr:DUF4149 domain-containing protein [Pyrinomonadaceae bacterium]
MPLNELRLFLLALWLGAAMLFSAVVAPVGFSVLRALAVPNANELAGTIVSRTLAIVNTSGFVISLLVLLTAFASRRLGGRRWFWLELILLTIVALTTVIGRWVIASKMLALRASMVLPIDQVAPEDPRRIAFNALHRYSVTALLIAMMAAVIAFFVMARRTRLN